MSIILQILVISMLVGLVIMFYLKNRALNRQVEQNIYDWLKTEIYDCKDLEHWKAVCNMCVQFINRAKHPNRKAWDDTLHVKLQAKRIEILALEKGYSIVVI